MIIKRILHDYCYSIHFSILIVSKCIHSNDLPKSLLKRTVFLRIKREKESLTNRKLNVKKRVKMTERTNLMLMNERSTEHKTIHHAEIFLSQN